MQFILKKTQYSALYPTNYYIDILQDLGQVGLDPQQFQSRWIVFQDRAYETFTFVFS